MGNHALPFNLTKQPSRSRYSHIDRKSNLEQSAEESQIDQWDSSWKDVTHQNIYYRIEYGKLHTFRNDITSEEVERYRIVLNDKKDFQKWKEMLHWRNNSQYLTKIQHFSLQNQGEVCVSQFQINLFIQRIPLRLVDLTDIPYPQNLYFLLSVLKGFKYIFSSPFPIKSFRVTESMICVNKEGEVKVWLNPNLSDFEPINEKHTTYAAQEEILKNLIELVQQNTDQRDYPYPFRQYLLDKNILINGDFNVIIQQIYTYSKDMKVSIPKYAFSVRDILSKEYLNNKLDSQNSFSHKPYFKNQNSSIRRDQSMSVLNSFDFQPQRKQQIDNKVEENKAEFFPKQKTHGLISTNNILTNYNFPTISELPMVNGIQQKNQTTNNFVHIPYYNNFAHDFKSQQIRHQPGAYIALNNSLTDRNFPNNNLNDHLMRINKIGNNIIQYPQSDISYSPTKQEPHLIGEKNQVRQTHSLEKHLSLNHNINVPHFPPPGYRMVERKIVHPIGFDPINNTKFPPNFNPSLNYQTTHHSNQSNHHHMTQNQSFGNIERVNSTRIPFPMTQKSYISELGNRPQSIQRDSYLTVTETKRPEQISSRVQIQRINRQSSHRTFTNNEHSQESMKKTNSFKNNLIKSQHQEKQIERVVSNVKYFTKKDSQQTLDPQIAGDLMKYLGQQF